jgi:hypothetical protein
MRREFLEEPEGGGARHRLGLAVPDAEGPQGRADQEGLARHAEAVSQVCMRSSRQLDFLLVAPT